MRRKPETLQFLDQVIVHGRLKTIMSAIAKVHRTTGKKPKSLVVTGRSGAGKTTLLKHYMKKVPQQDTETVDHRPVIFFEVPPQSDLRSFQIEMLRAVGHPRPDMRATLGQMQSVIIDMLKTLRVELIIVDEFHDALYRTTKAAPHIARLIKYVMNELEIPWVLTGLPEAAEVLESGDQQLRRRLDACQHLEPFGIDSDARFDEFRGYLRAVQRILPFSSVNLDEENVALRMYCATQGLPGFISNLIEELIEHHDGDRRATKSDFAAAYAAAFWEERPLDDGLVDFNPFLENMDVVRRAIYA